MDKKMTMSFLLACALVIGVLWLVVESDRAGQKQNIPAPNANTSLPPHVAGVPGPTSDSSLQAGAALQGMPPGGSGIIKCTVNGKTIYSDQECPDGAKTHQVTLHDTAGVISPKKETLLHQPSQRVAAENTQFIPPQSLADAPPQTIQAECAYLILHIEQLDSMARQAQSGQMQDWIRQERRNARDRQAAIQC